jgi:hypothetical protein
MPSEAERVYARRGRLVRDGWYAYAERILPKNAPAVQRQETRRAFYAGAWELLSRLAELGEPEIPEDAGVEVLEATRREIEAFFKSVGTSAEGR